MCLFVFVCLGMFCLFVNGCNLSCVLVILLDNTCAVHPDLSSSLATTKVQEV